MKSTIKALGLIPIVTLTLATVGYILPNAHAQSSNQVGLVVAFGDGSYVTRCIEFNESEITGYDVLQRSGLSVVVDSSSGAGVIICDINSTSGCSASNCFCQCQASPCKYWAYHHLVDDSWQYSQLGASSYEVHNGDVEGWAWGEGTINSSGAQPPVIPFDQICAPPATDTPVPTETPIPPTDTPASTNTPIPPTNTPIPPTDTPSPTDTPTSEEEVTSVPTPEAWFRLDENPVAAGACTMLRWNTSNAQEVYLDGEEVDPNGSREICPTTPQEHELRVVGSEDEEVYHLTLGVTGSAPTSTFTPQPSVTTQPATSVPPSPTSTAQKPTSAPPVSPSSSALPSASPSSAPTVATPSATPTPAQIAQSESTSTPARDVQQKTEDQQPSSDDQSTPSLVPTSYVAFSLIVGGLLGWLIFLIKVRQ